MCLLGGAPQALQGVLATTGPPFSLDLAALAAQRDLLSLESWLQEALSAGREQVFRACLAFLRTKAGPEAARPGAPSSPVAPQTLAVFFKVLLLFLRTGQMGPQSQELAMEWQAVYEGALKSSPSLAPALAQQGLPPGVPTAGGPSLSPGAHLGGPGGGISDSAGMGMDGMGMGGGSGGPSVQAPAAEVFASDVEEEANGYFQKLYAGQLTVGEVIPMLQRFSSSVVQRYALQLELSPYVMWLCPGYCAPMAVSRLSFSRQRCSALCACSRAPVTCVLPVSLRRSLWPCCCRARSLRNCAGTRRCLRVPLLYSCNRRGLVAAVWGSCRDQEVFA